MIRGVFLERFNRILSHKDFKFKVSQIERLERGRVFCHHSLQHLVDTARVAYILSLEGGLNIPKDLIYATALLHDIGRYDEYVYGKPHTEVSQGTIDILKSCGYSLDEVTQIVEAIEHHQERPKDVKTLSDVLYRADKLSRLCFNCNARDECYWSDSVKNDNLTI